MIIIHIHNDFHNTSIGVRTDLPATLTALRCDFIAKRLCPYADCTCGGTIGQRGPQEITIEDNSVDTVQLSA